MFERLLKEPPSVWREGELAFASGWSGAALLVAIALAALVVVVSLWRSPLSAGRRTAIGALQLLVAAVALTMLWRPALELERSRPGENAIAWLLDSSASMQTDDVEGRSRRDASVDALLDGGLLEDERFGDRLIAFGERSVELEALESVDEPAAGPARSDVAGAIDSVLSDIGGTSLAAVVLVSDGADNVGGADAPWWQRLAAAGVPVHTVGVGTETDADDVELASVELPRTVPGGTMVRARLRIVHGTVGEVQADATSSSPDAAGTSRGGEADEASVRLRVTRGEALVYADDIALEPGATESVRYVSFAAGEPGLQRLDFRIERNGAGAAESNPINNVQSRILDVRDDPRRVLYVEGEPRWEYKFLRRALEGHAGVEIVSLLRTSPNKFYRQGVRDANELADGFPRTREALFAYDAIIVGSFPAAELDAGQQAALRDFVNVRGGSLLMLAGRRGLADGGWARSGVAAALPVMLDARIDAETYRRERARVLPSRQGLRAEWLRLDEGEGASAAVWTELPEVADRQSLGRVKPGARVLLSDERDEPVLVAQRYGRGNSFVLGTSGTWRWQMGMPSEDESHERFWRALVGELAARAQPRLSIDTGEAIVRDADATFVTVDALAADFTPLVAATLRAEVTTPSGAQRSIELLADPARAGRFTAEVALDADGAWGVAVTTPPDGESPVTPPASAERWLMRESGTAESFGARQQRDFLERVAASSGGRYLALENIDELPAALESENAALKRVEVVPLWNLPLLFLLLLAGKGGEWLLRLRWKRL